MRPSTIAMNTPLLNNMTMSISKYPIPELSPNRAASANLAIDHLDLAVFSSPCCNKGSSIWGLGGCPRSIWVHGCRFKTMPRRLQWQGGAPLVREEEALVLVLFLQVRASEQNVFDDFGFTWATILYDRVYWGLLNIWRGSSWLVV